MTYASSIDVAAVASALAQNKVALAVAEVVVAISASAAGLRWLSDVGIRCS